MDALGAGENHFSNFKWVLSESIPNGQYYIGGIVTVDEDGDSSNNIRYDPTTITVDDPLPLFQINPGLNDAWYNPVTDGQGFFIIVFSELGKVSLAWFTYDTELPPEGATANLGDPGHRWFTALGRYTDNQAVMGITFASDGIFDAATEIVRVKDGSIILTFTGCNSGTVEYDIPALGLSGIVPIQRVADDNIALCEVLQSE